jgi:hypothetical protein
VTDIRKLPKTDRRVETGPVQFGDDWPGVFIRGDDTARYAMALRYALLRLDPAQDPLNDLAVASLAALIEQCNLTRRT